MSAEIPETSGREAEEGWFSDGIATFGDRLVAAREAAGLNQKQLAERLGVRLKTVEAWEDDQKDPRANRLQMLSGMLNVSLRWLLTGEGEGIAAPGAAAALPARATALLSEIREIRSEMAVMADRLGRLESRLKLAFATEEA